MRLKANFVVFIFSSFYLTIVMCSRYYLTITQLSGDGSKSSIVISPMFFSLGLIYFNLERIHFVFNEHIVDFRVDRKRETAYLESKSFFGNGLVDLSGVSHKVSGSVV